MIISSAKAAEAASVLGVELAGLTLEDVTRAYRSKAKECHPDKLEQGAPTSIEWARLSWAKECLAHWLQNRPQQTSDSRVAPGPQCLRCKGAGRLKVPGRSFGVVLNIMCDTCRGTGTLEAVEDDHDD